MAFENGEMVFVSSGEMVKKMEGLVGVIIDTMLPKKENEETSSKLDENGDVVLYRVEFLGGRVAKPQGCPVWWPATELQLAE